MLEGVGVDVAAGHVVQQLQDLLARRQRLSLPLHEEYSLVPVNRDTPCKLIDFKAGVTKTLNLLLRKNRFLLSG